MPGREPVRRGADGILHYGDLDPALAELLDIRAHRYADREAIIEIDGPRLTYRELWTSASKIAGALQDRGIGVGDRVAIRLPEGARWVQAFFGALLSGAVPVPVNDSLGAAELAHILDDSAVDFVLDDEEIPQGRPFIDDGASLGETALLLLHQRHARSAQGRRTERRESALRRRIRRRGTGTAGHRDFAACSRCRSHTPAGVCASCYPSWPLVAPSCSRRAPIPIGSRTCWEPIASTCSLRPSTTAPVADADAFGRDGVLLRRRAGRRSGGSDGCVVPGRAAAVAVGRHRDQRDRPARRCLRLRGSPDRRHRDRVVGTRRRRWAWRVAAARTERHPRVLEQPDRDRCSASPEAGSTAATSSRSPPMGWCGPCPRRCQRSRRSRSRVRIAASTPIASRYPVKSPYRSATVVIAIR